MHFEDQSGAGGNRALALITVGAVGGAGEPRLLADLHLGDALGPAGDDPVERKLHRLAALKPRFDLYDRASTVHRKPWLIDLLVWRARRSERVRAGMSGVLEETRNPGRLVSVRGVLRTLFE